MSEKNLAEEETLFQEQSSPTTPFFKTKSLSSGEADLSEKGFKIIAPRGI